LGGIYRVGVFRCTLGTLSEIKPNKYYLKISKISKI
jgi:hypothetical protein